MPAMNKRLLSLVFLAIGAGALVLLVIKLEPQVIFDLLVRFAPAFPIILAIEFSSNWLSIYGWYYSFNTEERPGLLHLQLINFASLPLSGALPSGQAGEVLKGNLLRGRVASREIVSSLVLYNYLHVVTTALVMALAPVLALLFGGFELQVSLVLLAVSLSIMGVMVGLGLLLRFGLFDKVVTVLARLPIKVLKAESLGIWARDLDGRIHGMLSDRPGDFWRATFFLIVGRLVQVGEAFVILHWLGLSPDLTVAFMAFSGTALANYLLMVLPAREGFLEGSSWVVFEALGMSGIHGFTFEVVRRIRKIAFQIGGLVLLLAMSRKSD